jgi:hypothetical protein
VIECFRNQRSDAFGISDRIRRNTHTYDVVARNPTEWWKSHSNESLRDIRLEMADWTLRRMKEIAKQYGQTDEHVKGNEKRIENYISEVKKMPFDRLDPA